MIERLIVTFVKKINKLKKATPDTAIDPMKELKLCKEYLTGLLTRRDDLKDFEDGLKENELKEIQESTTSFNDRASCAFLDVLDESPDLPDTCHMGGSDMFAAFTANNRNSTEWVHLNGEEAKLAYERNKDETKGYLVFATKVNGKFMTINIDSTDKTALVINTYSMASKDHTAEDLCIEMVKSVLQQTSKAPRGSTIKGKKHYHEGLGSRGLNELLGIWATLMVALHPWRTHGPLNVSEKDLDDFKKQILTCLEDGNPYICKKAMDYPECGRLGCTHKRA